MKFNATYKITVAFLRITLYKKFQEIRVLRVVVDNRKRTWLFLFLADVVRIIAITTATTTK